GPVARAGTRLEGLEHHGLRRVRAVRNARADRADRLLLEGRVHGPEVALPPGAVLEEADAETPRELLLRGPVELHRQNIGVNPREVAKNRLGETRLVVEKPEGGVVAHDDLL